MKPSVTAVHFFALERSTQNKELVYKTASYWKNSSLVFGEIKLTSVSNFRYTVNHGSNLCILIRNMIKFVAVSRE